jgi:phytoene dehydrogenase-like protein
MPPLGDEALPGYVAWLPDRNVTLHRDQRTWSAERERAFGDAASLRQFWALIDRIAAVFREASRRGLRLPLRTPADLLQCARTLAARDWPLARFLHWTLGDALRSAGQRHNRPLAGSLSMLVEDTVHPTVDDAPLISAALGITIRGAGLSRPLGGMYGFWKKVSRHYRSLGGKLCLNCPVLRIEPAVGKGCAGYVVHTAKGALQARQVVSTLPAPLAAKVASAVVGNRLEPYLGRNQDAQGGAVVLFLGASARWRVRRLPTINCSRTTISRSATATIPSSRFPLLEIWRAPRQATGRL